MTRPTADSGGTASAAGAGSLRILFVGPEAHGSNSGSLARALRRAGHVVVMVDPDHIALQPRSSLALRVLGRLTRPLVRREVERLTARQCDLFRPDLCVVYKGSYFTPQALRYLKQRGVYCVNVFPDVSVWTHGRDIPACLPLYDHIFTTKTFGVKDMRDRLGITRSEFLSHGFEPDLHRPLVSTPRDLAVFGCDVSFIGQWSPKKQAYLDELTRRLPEIHLRVWGGYWQGQAPPGSRLARAIAGQAVWGDLYPLAIACSRINLGLLSEQRQGASSGDLTTSRTFHIPAAGGFMLHERTDELLHFFAEGQEVACFSSAEELAEKVAYYLAHPDERHRIQAAGHERCLAQYSLDGHARRIVEHYVGSSVR